MSNIQQNGTILSSKLYSPRIPSNVVPRMRLIELLDKDSDRPLTLVSAPTGYGKSMLIAQWTAQIKQASTWISLDEKDNDFFLFLNYLYAAIEKVLSEKGILSKSLLKTSTLPDVEEISTLLINDINQLQERFILVIDDYQLIHNTKIHDLIEGLLKYPSRNMHLVLISRNDPPLPLLQYISKNLITIVSIQTLRFTIDETRAFLKKAIPDKFDESIIEPLVDKMEGWVTGISLTILSLFDDQQLRIEDISDGTAYYLQEYLSTEITKNIEPEVAQYLLECSVLEEFCAPLINHLNSSRESNEEKRKLSANEFMLSLDKSHLFINCIDCENRWCKLHPLFKDFLRNKMAEEWSDEDLTNLHLSASNWFEENGYIKEAIKHSYLAKDNNSAYSIFEKNKHKGLNGGKWKDVEKWLNGIPDGIRKKHPITLPSTRLSYKTASGATTNLTKREIEVLNLVAQGLSNKEIASSLFLSPETIKKHIYRIFQKLDTHSRTETIRKASVIGLLPQSH
jgi:LuxR family maltose regulon positive regulatory protein